MTLESFFLGCFVFGFVLSLIAFLAGSSHLHLHHGHIHLHGHGHGSGHGGGNGVSKFNFGTIAAFLTWFGGSGYILSAWGGVGLALVLAGAAIGGVAGGALIFLFAAKVLAPNDRPLNPADYQVVGALGTVSSTVLPGGTGEMIYAQQGRRVAVAIRSERGTMIPAGRDVVVTRYEGGIAYVRDFDELSA
jgi:membrane protein implicated in regulation of membrane protease activity